MSTSQEQDDNMLDLKDFQSIDIEFLVENLFTKATIRGAPPEIAVLEIDESNFSLSLPNTFCNVKQHLMLEVFHEGQEVLRATANVKKKEDQKDGTAHYHLKLVQFDNKSWEKFMGLYTSRQEEIDNFFEMNKR
ncbi:MAG: hypothetical protein AB7F43_14990 [Bacteriovoracia bacterium]